MTTVTRSSAFLFPGHFTRPGMGKALFGHGTAADRILEEAESGLGVNLRKLMWESPEEILRSTENAQPAVFTVSFAAFAMLKELGIAPQAVCGRSFGDITAAAAAGCLAFGSALSLIWKRAEIFSGNHPGRTGKMALTLGLGVKQMADICSEAEKTSGQTCVIAGVNGPDNIIISGTPLAVERAVSQARAAGGHVMEVPVKSAFHSPLMREAAERFAETLKDFPLYPPSIPLVSDLMPSGYAQTANEVKELLVRQIPLAVNWDRRTGIMAQAGINEFIELGVEQGMAKTSCRLAPGTKAFSVQSYEDARGLIP